MWRNWSRSKCWLISLGVGLAFAAVVAAVALYCCLHIPRLPLPAGVSKRTEQLALTGRSVEVDFYLPPTADPAPLVVIAHGFSRNRKTMAGWGSMLAREGFLVVVPDLPSWSDHACNGRAVAELLAKVRAGGDDAVAHAVGPRRVGGVFGGRAFHASGGSGQHECVLLGRPGSGGYGPARDPGGGVAPYPWFCAAG